MKLLHSLETLTPMVAGASNESLIRRIWGSGELLKSLCFTGFQTVLPRGLRFCKGLVASSGGVRERHWLGSSQFHLDLSVTGLRNKKFVC